MTDKVIDAINGLFEDFKKVNDERLEAEAKGNEARARELSEKLDKIEADIALAEKEKKETERQNALLSERVDILEASKSREKKTAIDHVQDEYKDTFISFIRSSGTDLDARQKMKELRGKAQELGHKAINIGSDPDGGHGVPEELSRMIDKLMLKQSDILNEVKFIEVGSSDYKELLNINSAAAAWVAETGSRTEQQTPTLRQVAPTWGELYSYMFATEWAIQDAFFDVETWLVDNVSEQMAKSVDLAIWSGDGSSKPTGLTNATPVTTADHASPLRAAAALQYVPTDSASPQAMGFDDVFDLLYAVNRAYRPNAKFGCNTLTQGAIRKLKDSNGQYLWEPGMQVGQPARIAGFPVFTFEDMADSTTADGFYLAFGDWRKAYTLCYRRQLAITVDNNITAPGYVKFYVRRRFGGIVANNDALKLLKLADT